jgi:hypothetical protein
MNSTYYFICTVRPHLEVSFSFYYQFYCKNSNHFLFYKQATCLCLVMSDFQTPSPSVRIIAPNDGDQIATFNEFETTFLVSGLPRHTILVVSAVLAIDGDDISRFEILHDGPYSIVLPDLAMGNHTISVRLELDDDILAPAVPAANPSAAVASVPEATPLVVLSNSPLVHFRIFDEGAAQQLQTQPRPPSQPPPTDDSSVWSTVGDDHLGPSAARVAEQAEKEEGAGGGADEEASFVAIYFPPAGHCFVNASEVVVAIAISDGFFRSRPTPRSPTRHRRGLRRDNCVGTGSTGECLAQWDERHHTTPKSRVRAPVSSQVLGQPAVPAAISKVAAVVCRCSNGWS